MMFFQLTTLKNSQNSKSSLIDRKFPRNKNIKKPINLLSKLSKLCQNKVKIYFQLTTKYFIISLKKKFPKIKINFDCQRKFPRKILKKLTKFQINIFPNSMEK